MILKRIIQPYVGELPFCAGGNATAGDIRLKKKNNNYKAARTVLKRKFNYNIMTMHNTMEAFRQLMDISIGNSKMAPLLNLR